MSKLRVIVVHNDAAELDRISTALESSSHAVLPLDKMTEASEALGLQRFDAVVIAENTPPDELALFAANLRRLEQDRRAETRTSILTYSHAITEPKITANGQEPGYIDAFLPERFEPSAFTKTVEQLAVQLSQARMDSSADETDELAVFDFEGFSELLGHSKELLDEIIGLFLDESESQMQEMRHCLMTDNFDSLAKAAHTLKGSLGTLHAQRARANALALEIAANRGMKEDCRGGLERLRADLDELRPLLIAVRSEL